MTEAVAKHIKKLYQLEKRRFADLAICRFANLAICRFEKE